MGLASSYKFPRRNAMLPFLSFVQDNDRSAGCPRLAYDKEESSQTTSPS